MMDSKSAKKYLEKLKDKIFSLITLKENNQTTIKSYANSLSREVQGFNRVLGIDEHTPTLVSISSKLSAIDNSTPLPIIKQDVFKILNMIDGIIDEL